MWKDMWHISSNGSKDNHLRSVCEQKFHTSAFISRGFNCSEHVPLKLQQK